MKNYLLILFTLITFGAAAQKDTTKKINIPDTLKKDLFTAPDTVKHLHSSKAALIPPLAMIGYGASTFAIQPLRHFDRWIYREAIEHNPTPTTKMENVIQYSPVILTYGLNLVGVHGKNTFIDRTLIYVMAQGMMTASVFSLKHLTHRLRPDNSDYMSFPSGHTSNAFVGAEFMAQELGDKSAAYSVIGYGLGTTTGILRIYHQDHWLSDVIAGAGFGILSTKAAYLLYPYVRNRLFKAGREKEKNKDVPPDLKKKDGSSSILMPSYQNGNLGLQFAMQF